MSETHTFKDPVDQGLTLSEKAVDVHVVDGEELLARWYHSPHDADLMIWFDSKGAPIRFQLNATGQIVDWNSADGLRSGLIVEFEVRDTVAETIQFDDCLNHAAVDVARVVLTNAASVPKSVTGHLLNSLLDSRNNNGISLKTKSVQRRSRFWGRFKRWTTGA